MSGNAALTDPKAVEIRDAYARGRETYEELGRRFGFSTSHIANIILARSWPDAGGPIAPTRHGPLRGEDNPRAFLTAEKVAADRHAYARGGVSYAELARQRGVSKATVRFYITGQTWPDAGGPVTLSRHGPLRGVDNPRAKLSNEKVRKARLAYARGDVTYAELARPHGVTKAVIRRAITGQSWPDAGGPIAPTRHGLLRGEDHPRAKLSNEKVAEIIRAHAEDGASYGELARQNEVSKRTILDVTQIKHWKHLVQPVPEHDGLIPAIVKLAEGTYRVLGEALTISSRARGQRRLVDALVEAGERGLSTCALQNVCPDYKAVLDRLRVPGSAWFKAILPPDVLGKRDDHWRIAYCEPNAAPR